MPTAIETLIERLEKATGPDRALDADIHLEFGQAPNEHYNKPWRHPILLDEQHRRPGLLEYVEISGVSARAAPAYTGSLDAAVSLAPGWGYFIRKDEEGGNAALLYPEASRVTPGAAQAPTPALAFCLAALRTLAKVKS